MILTDVGRVVRLIANLEWFRIEKHHQRIDIQTAEREGT